MTPKIMLLEELIKQSGMSKTKIAKLSGIHAMTISHWLAYRSTPNIEKFDRVLRVLGYKMRISPK